MIALCRVDSRLVHGQVVEAWLPYLAVRRLVVADDATAADGLASMAMGLALPAEVELVVRPVASLDWALLAADAVRTLVLFRDVAAAAEARHHGLPSGPLNLGNVHAGPGRTAVSRSVFLDAADRATLAELAAGGMAVTVQAVPGESPTPVA